MRYLPRSEAGTTGSCTVTSGSRPSTGVQLSTSSRSGALPTIILMTTAYIIWITVAILAGVYAAVKRYSLFDSGLTIFNYVGYSLPTFWLGLMLITLFACHHYDGSRPAA